MGMNWGNRQPLNLSLWIVFGDGDGERCWDHFLNVTSHQFTPPFDCFVCFCYSYQIRITAIAKPVCQVQGPIVNPPPFQSDKDDILYLRVLSEWSSTCPPSSLMDVKIVWSKCDHIIVKLFEGRKTSKVKKWGRDFYHITNICAFNLNFIIFWYKAIPFHL